MMLSNNRLRKKFCHCSLKDLSVLVSELWYDGNRNTIIYLVHSIPHDFDATWKSKQQNKPLEMKPYISAIGLLSTSPALPVVRSQKPLPASWLHRGLWKFSEKVAPRPNTCVSEAGLGWEISKSDLRVRPIFTSPIWTKGNPETLWHNTCANESQLAQNSCPRFSVWSHSNSLT